MPLLPNGMVKLAGADEKPLAIASQALPFTRKNQEGVDVSLDEFAGQPVVLFICGRFANTLTARKFRDFVSLAPEIRRAGAAPICLTTNYWQDNQSYLADFREVDFPVLDDGSHALEAVSTYEQPFDGGTDYPVYVLDATHTNTYFRFGPDLFLDEHKPELLAEISRISRPVAIPPRPPATPAATV